jgi:phosphoribosylaminoimidazole-succinocarboxamide synthase
MTDLSSLPGVTRLGSGKVRELYAVDDRLLLVATDRVSAFDVILPTPIPGKGRVLTGISAFWFREVLEDLVPNHLLSTDVGDLPAPLQEVAEDLRGRIMIARRADMLPIECVARGYLAGSGWKDYQVSGRVCGVPLPQGLRESAELPAPIFTPATKATDGHDENISFDEAARLVGGEMAERLRDLTLRIYRRAATHAAERGILLADTKLEFGLVDGELVLCDEVLTPDSSRFWPAEDYAPGRGQASFDKQIVRDWLEAQPWDKTPPAPALPDEVVARTAARYNEVYERITGRDIADWTG